MRAASCAASATLVALKPHNGYGLWDGSKPPTTYGKWTSEMSQADGDPDKGAHAGPTYG